MSQITNSTSRTSCAQDLVNHALDIVDEHIGAIEPTAVRIHHGFSNNDLVDIRLNDGRALVVKRGRFTWAQGRFDAARTVAALLRDEAGVVAPEPLDVPAESCDRPVMAYWRIPLPTLQDIWPEETPKRADLIRSWGALIRRIHQIKLPGHGSVTRQDERGKTLAGFLDADLRHRLRPAIVEVWPEGISIVDRLLEVVPRIRGDSTPATLLHNDLHMGNVLCDHDYDGPRCVGFLDLESAIAGPAESDLANAALHHSPLFGQQAHEAGFYDLLLEGYGGSVDPRLVSFFKVYHFANMGFYSALAGYPDHARELAIAGRHSVKEAELVIDEMCENRTGRPGGSS